MVCKTIYGGSIPSHHSNALGGSVILSILVVARQRGVKDGRPETPRAFQQKNFGKKLDFFEKF